MAYVANQYNYATPLSSTILISEQSAAADKKYFTLFDNVLDGSYSPISEDVGLWGTSLSYASGVLATPFAITVTDTHIVHAFRLVGGIDVYPVSFTVTFYNGEDLLYTIDETSNTQSLYVKYLEAPLLVTHYTISITAISSGSNVARIYSVYTPMHIKRTDTASVLFADNTDLLKADEYRLNRVDTIRLNDIEHHSSILNTIDVTYDTLVFNSSGNGVLTNVHTRMKEPSRRIYGKVQITYTDPMLESATTISASEHAYNSQPYQVLDNDVITNGKFFNLYENDLSGAYVVSDTNSQVGWVSSALSSANGYFDTPQHLRIDFVVRPVSNLRIVFDDSRGAIPVDFTVEYILAGAGSKTYTFVDNASASIIIEDTTPNVTAVVISVNRLSKAGYPIVILDVPIVSTIEYVGYQDRSDLISISMLEELTYDDEIEALGGVSANTTTVALDNSNKDFYFNNPNSTVSSSLKRNRKIVPWLGVEIADGEIEWYTLGTFWSYRWDVPVESLVAKVVGFDTLGLLDKTSFNAHTMQVNKSIGQLIEYVLNDARRQLSFISYKIDPVLYDVIIPYAWFDNASHTAALRKISSCYPVHIYCDRAGNVCAAQQKLHLDYYYDTWSDSTNVISKSYSSLHTVLPNVISVEVKNPSVQHDQTLADDKLVFDVSIINTRTLNFNAPYVDSAIVTVDCDSTVSFTYDIYSWGIVLYFSGIGSVRSIRCVGTTLDISHYATIDRSDANSVYLNGTIKRLIKSDFIQTVDLATLLIERLFSLSEHDKYDVDVEYTGDIALSINDPILLIDGIAPDNRYNIKRHELYWDGALTGSAHLNT